MNLKPVLNKTSPQAHTESELDELGVPGKLMKYVVHLSKRKSWFLKNISSYKLPKLQSTSFWSQVILGVKIGDTQNSAKEILSFMASHGS
jgi:hypothetical protein